MDPKRIATIASLPAFLLAARFVPFDRLPPSCGFLNMTGLPCPTCGMTRSCISIAHLKFERAWQLNPLGFVFLGVFALWWVNALYQDYTGRRTWLSDLVSRRWGIILGAGITLILGFGFLRMWLLTH